MAGSATLINHNSIGVISIVVRVRRNIFICAQLATHKVMVIVQTQKSEVEKTGASFCHCLQKQSDLEMIAFCDHSQWHPLLEDAI